MPDLVRVKLENGAEANISAEWAKVCNIKPLDKPTHRDGIQIGPKYPVDLRGTALDEALDGRGLPKIGTVAEKQDRLAEANASTSQVDGNTPTTGSEKSASKNEESS